MLRPFLIILLSLLSFQAISAQQPEQRIGELINTENWFGLDKEYPILKDSIQTPFLKVVADAMIARNFNQKELALECMNELLSNHQSDLGAEVFNFIILRAQLLEEMGRYAEAADFIRIVLDQLKGQGVTQGLDAMEYYYQHVNVLRELPALDLSRPNHDVLVPFTLKELKPKRIESWMRKKEERNPDTKSVLITIPVTLHGETIPFHFDTGAGMTFVSEKFVREKGLPLIGDTVVYTGNSKGLRTFIDSLQIGEITVRNIVAGVGLEKESELADEYCHGNIGIAAVLQHRKTIINFRDMFVTFEK